MGAIEENEYFFQISKQIDCYQINCRLISINYRESYINYPLISIESTSSQCQVAALFLISGFWCQDEPYDLEILNSL